MEHQINGDNVSWFIRWYLESFIVLWAFWISFSHFCTIISLNFRFFSSHIAFYFQLSVQHIQFEWLLTDAAILFIPLKSMSTVRFLSVDFLVSILFLLSFFIQCQCLSKSILAFNSATSIINTLHTTFTIGNTNIDFRFLLIGSISKKCNIYSANCQSTWLLNTILYGNE